MRYSDKIEFFEQLESEGKPTPLSEMPILDFEIVYYLNAFGRLTGSRNSGLSIGKIPFSEIKCYIDLFGTIDGPEIFVDIINLLDDKFIEYHSKSKPKDTKPARRRK